MFCCEFCIHNKEMTLNVSKPDREPKQPSKIKPAFYFILFFNCNSYEMYSIHSLDLKSDVNTKSYSNAHIKWQEW